MSKAKKKSSDSAKEPMPVISFKIAQTLYNQLAELGEKQIDDAGNALSAAGMARKIVRDHLIKTGKN